MHFILSLILNKTLPFVYNYSPRMRTQGEKEEEKKNKALDSIISETFLKEQ